jgi:hypothetical protein
MSNPTAHWKKDWKKSWKRATGSRAIRAVGAAVIFGSVAALFANSAGGAKGPPFPQLTGLQGLELVTAPSACGPATFKQATAVCPDGKGALGGGFRITDCTNNIFLNNFSAIQSHPSPGGEFPTNWFVTAWDNNPGNNTDWQLTAFVTCATLPGSDG